ncbi:907_t:CDS:2, partial [Gigaspora rosea]
ITLNDIPMDLYSEISNLALTDGEKSELYAFFTKNQVQKQEAAAVLKVLKDNNVRVKYMKALLETTDSVYVDVVRWFYYEFVRSFHLNNSYSCMYRKSLDAGQNRKGDAEFDRPTKKYRCNISTTECFTKIRFNDVERTAAVSKMYDVQGVMSPTLDSQKGHFGGERTWRDSCAAGLAFAKTLVSY